MELLGVTWALQACNFYLKGHPGFKIKSDHNPLIGVLKKDIRDVSEKMQPMMEICSMYNFEIEYVPGKKHLVADLLSRSPMWGDQPEVVDKCGRAIGMHDPMTRVREDPKMAEILNAAADSAGYTEAVKAKLDGLSAAEVKRLPFEHGAREYQR